MKLWWCNAAGIKKKQKNKKQCLFKLLYDPKCFLFEQGSTTSSYTTAPPRIIIISNKKLLDAKLQLTAKGHLCCYTSVYKSSLDIIPFKSDSVKIVLGKLLICKLGQNICTENVKMELDEVQLLGCQIWFLNCAWSLTSCVDFAEVEREVWKSFYSTGDMSLSIYENESSEALALEAHRWGNGIISATFYLCAVIKWGIMFRYYSDMLGVQRPISWTCTTFWSSLKNKGQCTKNLNGLYIRKKSKSIRVV